jgi:hypothetical protein
MNLVRLAALLRAGVDGTRGRMAGYPRYNEPPVCRGGGTSMLGRFSFFVATLLVAAGLKAGPVNCVSGGTLASYEALGSTGCLVGPLNVKDFAFSVLSGSGGATDLNIFVTTTFTSPLTYGLSFGSNAFVVTGNGSVTYLLAYTWDPTEDIQSLDDVMDPPSAVPPGFAKITTVGCINAAFIGASCPTNTVTIFVIQDGLAPRLTDSVSFTPVPIVGVRHTIELTGNGGSASFDALGNNSQITPEPASWLGCVTFLILLAARLRQVRARAQS